MALRKPLFMSAEGFSEEMAPTDSAAYGALIISPGNIDMSSTGKIVNLVDPTNPQDAATKYYVDSVATGLDWKNSARLGTAAALPAYTAAGSGVGKTLTATANGALSVDGTAVNVNDRVLVKNESGGSLFNNGLYSVTAPGSAGTSYVLTRTTDADSNAEVTAGLAVFVTEGSTNADSGWVLITDDAIVLDTTGLTFAQFSSTVSYVFGAGLKNTAGTIDVELDTAAAAQTAGSGGGSSGLEFDTTGTGGKLRAAVNATGGIQRSGTGLAVLLNGSSIVSGASGLSTAWAPLLQEDRLVVEAIAVADPVYESTTNNQVGKARADTNSKANVIGVAKTAQPTIGNAATLVYHGTAVGIISAATAGDQYYLQPTGGLGTTVPGASNRVISLGFAKNATDLFVRIFDYGKKAA